MSAQSKSQGVLGEVRALLSPVWLVLAVGVALLLLVFRQEDQAAVQVWYDDTAR